MLKSTMRSLLEKIISQLLLYIDNWQPRHIIGSTDAVRENFIRAHTLLSTLANKPDKRIEQCCRDIETTLKLFGEFYDTARSPEALMDCSMKICVLAQKGVDIISSIPSKDAKVRPPYYWTKRIVISLIVSFIMSAIVIPRLPMSQHEQSALSPIAQPETIPNTASNYATVFSPPQVVPETQSNDIVEPTEVRAVLSGVTNGTAWEYRGSVLNGHPHGLGRQEFDDGSWFDGQWSNGRFLQGEGMYICASGDWFIGSFLDGYWTTGVLHMHPSGAVYTGEFTHRNGRHYRHGRGRIEFPNGDWYDGGWRYDQRHGQGEEYHAATGTRRPGVWFDNVLQ